MPNERRTIGVIRQIAVCAGTNDGGADGNADSDHLYALDESGVLWQLFPSGWARVPDHESGYSPANSEKTLAAAKEVIDRKGKLVTAAIEARFEKGTADRAWHNGYVAALRFVQRVLDGGARKGDDELPQPAVPADE